MENAEAFIAGLPKAELHLHIEGTLEPEMMFALGARNKVALPYRSVDEVRAAYRFRNLQEFLDLYYQGMSVLVHERDFYDLAYAYFERAAAENVRHAEIFFDPQAHTRRGVPFAAVIEGITRARHDAETRLGITSKLILCFLRDLPAEDAMAALEAGLAYRDRIVGVGLDSAEVGNPPRKFAAVFARARAEGLLAVAHAGEEGPPEYVTEALDLLAVERIDHGNRALEDPALVARLVAAQVPITVCPLSNLKLGVVREMPAHPLKSMLDRSLLTTVNSDDPAYFGGYVNQNYIAVTEALELTRDDLITLARNSFAASFLSARERTARIDELETYAGAPT